MKREAWEDEAKELKHRINTYGMLDEVFMDGVETCIKKQRTADRQALAEKVRERVEFENNVKLIDTDYVRGGRVGRLEAYANILSLITRED